MMIEQKQSLALLNLFYNERDRNLKIMTQINIYKYKLFKVSRRKTGLMQLWVWS